MLTEKKVGGSFFYIFKRQHKYHPTIASGSSGAFQHIFQSSILFQIASLVPVLAYPS